MESGGRLRLTWTARNQMSSPSSLTNSALSEMKLKRSSGLLPMSCSTILAVEVRSASDRVT